MDTNDKRNTTGLSPGAYFICLVINDLPDSIQNNSTAIMFADDIKPFARTDTSKDKENYKKTWIVYVNYVNGHHSGFSNSTRISAKYCY